MLINFSSGSESFIAADSGGVPSIPVSQLNYPNITYSNRTTLTTSGTPQLVSSGGMTSSFSGNVIDLTIQHVDKACYISKTIDQLYLSGSGWSDGRMFVPSGIVGLTIPWSGKNVYMVNAVSGETPTIHVTGQSIPGLQYTEPQYSTVLSKAVAYSKVSKYSGSGSLLDLSGNGHHAQLGSTSGSDTNDPTALGYDGFRGIYLPGISGNYMSAPDSTAISITGSIDGDVYVGMDKWPPITNSSLLGKWEDTGNQKSFLFMLLLTGELRLQLSTDGVNSTIATSSATISLSPGASQYVRFTWRASDGRVQFFTSVNGTTWVQLGVDQTTATSSIFDSSALLTIGGHRTVIPSLPCAGKFYRARLYDGIRENGGLLVFDADFTDLTKYNSTRTTITEKSSNFATVTLNRTATGRKLCVVDRSLMLLGTDDYLEIPNHVNLNFGLGEDFTILFSGRSYAIADVENKNLLTNSNVGIFFDTSGVLKVWAGSIATGPIGAPSIGRGFVVAGRRSAGNIQAIVDGVGSTVVRNNTDRTTVLPWRIGGLPGGAGYFNGEFFGYAIFRYALSDAEIARAGEELLQFN